MKSHEHLKSSSHKKSHGHPSEIPPFFKKIIGVGQLGKSIFCEIIGVGQLVGKIWKTPQICWEKTHGVSRISPEGTATAPWPRWRLEPWLWRRSLDSAMRRWAWARWAGAVAPGEGKP